MSGAGEDFALALFQKSVLKQVKYRQIVALLGDTTGLECLDVGGGQRGGEPDAQKARRSMAQRRPRPGNGGVDGRRTPFPDGSFDRIVNSESFQGGAQG